MQKFKIVGKPLLGEKYMEGKRRRRKNKKIIMPSLVATFAPIHPDERLKNLG